MNMRQSFPNRGLMVKEAQESRFKKSVSTSQMAAAARQSEVLESRRRRSDGNWDRSSR